MKWYAERVQGHPWDKRGPVSHTHTPDACSCLGEENMGERTLIGPFVAHISEGLRGLQSRLESVSYSHTWSQKVIFKDKPSPQILDVVWDFK